MVSRPGPLSKSAAIHWHLFDYELSIRTIHSFTELSCTRPVMKGVVTKSHKRRYHRGDRLVLRCQSGENPPRHPIPLGYVILYHLIMEQAVQVRRWSANPMASGRGLCPSVTRKSVRDLARTADRAPAATSASVHPATAVVIASMVEPVYTLIKSIIITSSLCHRLIIFFFVMFFFLLCTFYVTSNAHNKKLIASFRACMAVPAWPRIVVHVDMDTLDIDVKSVGSSLIVFSCFHALDRSITRLLDSRLV